MSQPALQSDLALQYLARFPLDTLPNTRPPLLILLHGVGSHEADLFRFVPRLNPRFLVLSVRAPLTQTPGSYAWFTVDRTTDVPRIASEELHSSRDMLAAFIAQALTTHDADPERVFLLGFSQGAIMSMTLALTQPRLLAGIVAIAGRIPPEVLSWAGPPEQTAGFPVLLEHGRQDQVLPIEWAHRARAILGRQRVDLIYREYDAPHTITQEMLVDAATWLDERLNTAPRTRNSR